MVFISEILQPFAASIMISVNNSLTNSLNLTKHGNNYYSQFQELRFEKQTSEAQNWADFLMVKSQEYVQTEILPF